jgi:redox-sensitive bicupin YhaK (pirin superfamily)
MSIRPAVQWMTAGRGSLHREMPQGAIVMNTRAELQQRLRELRNGTFITR